VSPVGESENNEDMEKAVKQVQGQSRTVRSQLQAKYTTKVNEDSEVLAWLMPHAAHVSNRYLVGPDRRTPRLSLKGKA